MSSFASRDRSSLSRKTKNQQDQSDSCVSAQQGKYDVQSNERKRQMAASTGKTKGQKTQDVQKCSSTMAFADAINEYLQDHQSRNHSEKTIEWHFTALNLLRQFLAEERNISLVREVDATAISAWLTALRLVPGKHGKLRSERTVQTYARSARAFFSWLVRREMIEQSPFEQIEFPKVGRPCIQTIEPEEFECLLHACAPPHESGQLAERAVARNRAILWLLYDTGIRVSELCRLQVSNFDRRHSILTVKGRGSKERRIPIGTTCLRNLLHYLDRHRPDEAELAEWGSAGEDHLFLSEMRTALTKDGIEMLFKRVRERAGMTGKRISPHIFRHTFAIRYLVLGNDPFSLQELLGHSDLSMVKLYMHMNDEMLQSQKRVFSPGDHVPMHMQGPTQARRTGFHLKMRGKGTGV